jgi:hypothetical protein
MRKTVRAVVGIAIAVVASAIIAPMTAATATAAPAGIQSLESSYFTGTIAPGATTHRWWNNANPLSVSYAVGLSPKGASTTTDCQFEVTRSYYQQNFGGEREFHYDIKNVGTISCGTDVYLYSLSDVAGAWNTGGVNPGQSVTKHWNNAGSLNSYLAGLSPDGATSTAPCQFEVTREWYSQTPTEKEFWFTIKNVGTIACSAEVLLGTRSTTTTSSIGATAPGGTGGSTWNNNPETMAYILGLTPSGATPATPCQFEVTRTWYGQTINTDGSAEKEFHHTWKNSGTITCSATKLFAWA